MKLFLLLIHIGIILIFNQKYKKKRSLALNNKNDINIRVSNYYNSRDNS